MDVKRGWLSGTSNSSQEYIGSLKLNIKQIILCPVLRHRTPSRTMEVLGDRTPLSSLS